MSDSEHFQNHRASGQWLKVRTRMDEQLGAAHPTLTATVEAQTIE